MIRGIMARGEVAAVRGELIAECAAFLQGQMASRLEHASMVVPAWAWINALAHGDEAMVAAMAAGASPTRAIPHRSWHTAVSYLATEIGVVQAETGASLHDVQRACLVPVEFALFPLSLLASLDPAPVVAEVVRRLDEFRARRIQERRAAERVRRQAHRCTAGVAVGAPL